MKKFLLIVLIGVVGWLVLVSIRSNDPLPQVVTPSPTPSILAITPNATLRPSLVLLSNVTFTSQAPLGDWDDPRQQDGCEEASALMAVHWARGTTFSKEEALREIVAISDYEQATYGGYHDTSAQDTVKRIFEGYFQFTGATVELDITTKDIEAALRKGMLVVVPADGRKLANPNYTPPGPDRHMLPIIGYDPQTDEFITHDPGTRKGKNFRYKSSVLQSALINYPSGDHLPLTSARTAMIVVSPDVR